MKFVLNFLLIFLQGLRFFLLIGTLLPWILPADSSLRMGIARIMDPLLLPFRKVIKPIGGFDFTPMVLYFILLGIETLIGRYLMALLR